jgi:drug/metabolite transporter (DMT)-like permease
MALKLPARLQADALLLITAVIWGGAFAAQRAAVEGAGVFFFNGSRFLLGASILLPFALKRPPIGRARLPLVGLAGALLFGASALQQAGLRLTTAGNAGFITGLYVVLVPLLLRVAWGQRLQRAAWAAAAAAAVGMFLLSAGTTLRLAPGDALELAGAVLWALHVIIVGRAAQNMDALRFAVGQFVVCGALNLATAGLWEGVSWSGVAENWWAIEYTGVLSVGVGYTLQVLGQKHAPPNEAAILLSLESVFAALAGFVFLQETMKPVQIAGCGLILAAAVMAQWRRP